MKLIATIFAASFGLFATAAQPPVVRVDADAPIAVAGNGFRSKESVAVSIVMGTHRLTATSEASDAGEFTVRFPGTRLDRCATPLVISAKGEHTGKVVAVLPPRECPAP